MKNSKKSLAPEIHKNFTKIIAKVFGVFFVSMENIDKNTRKCLYFALSCRFFIDFVFKAGYN